MPLMDDIFGGGNAIELIIRWHDHAVSEFNSTSPRKFEWLKSNVGNIEFKCYFLKVKDEEQKILITSADDQYDIELYVEWLPLTFSYKIKVNKSKKTKLISPKVYSDEIRQWIKDGYVIEETCKLVFIDINEPRMFNQGQASLYDRTKRLELLPKTKIENDRDIWDKWIEAQDLMLRRNAQPFKIRKYHPLLEVKSDSGVTTRYKFKVDLPVEENREYKEVEEELLNEFHINAAFDEEGNIFLKFDDIYRGLDHVIHKKFKDKIEREKSIAAILRLKPLTLSEKIERFFRNAGYQIFCFNYNRELEKKTAKVKSIINKGESGNSWEYNIQFENGDEGSFLSRYSNQNYFEVGETVSYIFDKQKKRITADNASQITITSVNVPFSLLSKHLEAYGYEFKKYIGEFEVINNGKDITQNAALNKKHKIAFEEKKESHILPRPVNNRFTIVQDEEWMLMSFALTLKKIYGSQNVLMRKSLVFQKKATGFHRMTSTDFTEDFWNDIKRDIYALDFKVETNETTGTIAYDFEAPEECFAKLKQLQAINKFEFLISPEHPEFKFKVKTNLLKNKTEKQIFLDKISDLANVEFQVPIGKEDKRMKYLQIGKLNAHESDLTGLVFSLPLKRKEEQKAAAKLLEYIEQNKPIFQVEPNLRGDQAKIGWLLTAMKKVVAPTDKPNGKAVNLKLGQFIFDSSKAEEVFKDIAPNSEEWNRVRNNELLTLNDSQRKGILSALHARDLCLLQGPPGTGKTTVIAELIWQMISQNQQQKILLTSETNLAVDNALEKLLNKEHTLVKPLRFGKDTKFEEEGKKYSFNRILKWIDEKFEPQEYEDDSLEEQDEEEIAPDNPYNNAVQIWMNRIAEKSHKKIKPKYANALKDWVIELTQPEKEIKQRFKDKYFKYANVIGSTCSSSGSSSFFGSYGDIFIDNFKTYSQLEFLLNKAPFAKKKIIQYFEELELLLPDLHEYNILLSRYWDEFNERESFYKEKEDLDKLRVFKEEGCRNLASYIQLYNYVQLSFYPLLTALKINFDAVIMDEASKATPPEMLLPLCFATKSIVIGDHKQLPPMLNDKEFREALSELKDEKAKKLAEEIDKEFVETSQFERLILNPKVPKSIAARLNIQYRMHPKINNVIKQFYTGETDEGLEPSQELIENADKEDLSNPFSRHHGFWNEGFIKPDIHTIWINVNEPEEQSGTSRINEKEVEAVKSVLQYLKNSKGFEEYFSHWEKIKNEDKKLQEQEIGIISFYGHQVRKLQDVRRYAQKDLGLPIRLKTVDKFQGMERNIIIVSTVRSDKIIINGLVGRNNDIGFAKAPERLNVALSRARRLLIVVGNLNFFESYKDKNGNTIYKNAIDIIRREGLIIEDYKKLSRYK